MGQKTGYKPEYAKLAQRQISLHGYKPKDLAFVLGVSEDSIERWKKSFVTFRNAIDLGQKAYADSEEGKKKAVEEALYKRAVGYRTIEKKTVTVDEDTTTVTETDQEVTPSVDAQKFFLKNRDSKRWKDKVELESDGKALKGLIIVLSGDEKDESSP